MARKKKKVEVVFVFTKGWEERFAESAYLFWKERKKGECD